MLNKLAKCPLICLELHLACLERLDLCVQIVGPFGDNTDVYFGNYASDQVKQFTPFLGESLSHLATSVYVARGCSNPRCVTYDSGLVKRTVDGADVVIVALGTGSDIEGEGNDRRDISFPGHQLQLLQDAVAAG